MKRILLAASLICSLCVSRAYAQQEPRYTHYMFNTLTYNPAYAASKQSICASLLYHNQWTGFNSVDKNAISPLTETFSLMGMTPIGAKSGRAAGTLGLGLSIVSDKIGYSNSTGAMLNIAYRFTHLVPFAEYVSVGISGGLMQQAIAPDWKAPDPNDPRLPGQSTSGVPDMNAGIYMGSRNVWYAGISTTHFIQSKASWESKIGGSKIQIPISSAYYIVGGYSRPLNANFDLQTHAQIETDFAKYQLSVSGMALYKQKIYGGLTLRTEKLTPIAVMAGFYPTVKGKGSLLIAAAYDIPTSHSSIFGGGPEFFARYCFNLNIATKEPVFMKDGRHL